MRTPLKKAVYLIFFPLRGTFTQEILYILIVQPNNQILIVRLNESEMRQNKNSSKEIEQISCFAQFQRMAPALRLAALPSTTRLLSHNKNIRFHPLCIIAGRADLPFSRRQQQHQHHQQQIGARGVIFVGSAGVVPVMFFRRLY